MHAPIGKVANNPLLQNAPLPLFEQIEADHVEPAVTQIIALLTKRFEAIVANIQPTWEKAIQPLTEIEEDLHRVWSPISHLNSVRNSPELRQAYEKSLPAIIDFSLQVSQNSQVFEAMKAIRNSNSWQSLDGAQKRILEQKIRTAELAGVGLQGSSKQRFNAIEQELTKIKTTFSNNVLDSSKAFQLVLENSEDIDGLPESLLSLASQTYRNAFPQQKSHPKSGPWLFTLDPPCFVPFMQYSTRRPLREKLYRAFVSRASSGQWDNGKLIPEILKLRREKANLLGYATYAEYSLATKMAKDVPSIFSLLEQLRQVGFPKAKAEIDQLRKFAADNGQKESLMNWDVAFWRKRLQEKLYQYDEEEVKQYFPYQKVVNGLFQLVEKIFSIKVQPSREKVQVWHPDVQFYEVYNKQSQHIASFFLDPYSRPHNKRGGAWMDECAVRNNSGKSLQLPVAYLVCNFTPPVDGQPSLLTFRDVQTLFHEFGHGLQQMLTTVDYPTVAGINGVEWDAVELPSQFMENWCFHRDTLKTLAEHVETKAPLPEELFSKIEGTRTFFAGSDCMRQLFFAMTDLRLHGDFTASSQKAVFDVEREVAQLTMVVPPLPEDRHLCSFLHIFAGGYAAGYYSYKWAEVLSSDAFGAFEDVGLNNLGAIVQMGEKFRDTVLSLGGSVHPSEVFRRFRGRDPIIEPLLRHSGLS